MQISRTGAGAPVVPATLEPGFFFGEMAIVDQTERTATAEALTDATVLVMHASELELLLKQRPALGPGLRSLARRLRYTTNQLGDEKE